MWLGAKLTLKKLLYDDSGVAMAYTVLVSLFIFMLCVSTYAMTENIRQKMELQNACDAAAYSGAVVQADMLSRIAVLNRALSWTYYQTNKRHMDYIVDIWIDAVLGQHEKDSDYVKEFNDRSCHPKIPLICFFATSFGGLGTSSLTNQLNDIRDFRGRDDDESVAEYEQLRHDYYLEKCMNIINSFKNYSAIYYININSAPDLRSYIILNYARKWEKLENEIGQANETMGRMEDAIGYLKKHISEFSIKAADNTLISAGYKTDNRIFAVFAGENGVLVNNTIKSFPEANYFQNVTTEKELLAFSGHTRDQLGAGEKTWWTLRDNRQSGAYREYTSGLNASYDCFSTRWQHIKVCVPYDFISYSRTIEPDRYSSGAVKISSPGGRCAGKYDPIGDSSYFTSRQTLASKLDKSFFGRNGSIVVAAKKPLVNPFSIILGDSGLYGAFNGMDKDMWALSAARAGVKLNNENTDGKYETRYPGDDISGYTNRVWNLCEEDWDAVMLPVARAWNNTDVKAWGSESIDNTTTDLLNAVHRKLGVKTNYSADFIKEYNPFNPQAVKR